MARPVSNVVWLSLCCVLCSSPAPVWSWQLPIVQRSDSGVPVSGATKASAVEQQPDQQAQGNIRGKVIDQSGASITGAVLKLARAEQSLSRVVQSDEDGQFFFANVAPGPFQLTISSEGLAAQTVSGSVAPGETYIVPPIIFYNGKGSRRLRILYALANAVICKGDSGHWQPNYSNIGGDEQQTLPNSNEK